MMGGGQYEYSIDGSNNGNAAQAKANQQNLAKQQQATSNNSNLPKRTPHSELTTY